MCFREQLLSVGCDIDGVNHLDHPTLGLLIVVVIVITCSQAHNARLHTDSLDLLFNLTHTPFISPLAP